MKITPILKWAGGKTQILDELRSRLPKQFNTYFEPFIGGGALLFSLLPSSAIINDINNELINVYNCVKNKETYHKLLAELDKHQENHDESYYYHIRGLDRHSSYHDMNDYERAARIIYLNKTCFCGLYRVNSRGYFNVPIGSKKKKNLYVLENIQGVHEYLSSNNIEILNKDYTKAVEKAKAGDFVYFDPPYDYEGSGFTSYTASGFSKEDQTKLYMLFKELSDRGVYVMLSNNNTAFIRDLYKDYNIDIVKAKRVINSDASNRGDVEEVIITNY